MKKSFILFVFSSLLLLSVQSQGLKGILNRIAKDTYQQFEGTGIGLSICKKIVEKHKGFISAKSTLNEGATFIITLPEKGL